LDISKANQVLHLSSSSSMCPLPGAGRASYDTAAGALRGARPLRL
jgi:hypothetical protein